jgi:hypothetical protein
VKIIRIIKYLNFSDSWFFRQQIFRKLRFSDNQDPEKHNQTRPKYGEPALTPETHGTKKMREQRSARAMAGMMTNYKGIGEEKPKPFED